MFWNRSILTQPVLLMYIATILIIPDCVHDCSRAVLAFPRKPLQTSTSLRHSPEGIEKYISLCGVIVVRSTVRAVEASSPYLGDQPFTRVSRPDTRDADKKQGTHPRRRIQQLAVTAEMREPNQHCGTSRRTWNGSSRTVSVDAPALMQGS